MQKVRVPRAERNKKFPTGLSLSGNTREQSVVLKDEFGFKCRPRYVNGGLAVNEIADVEEEREVLCLFQTEINSLADAFSGTSADNDRLEGNALQLSHSLVEGIALTEKGTDHTGSAAVNGNVKVADAEVDVGGMTFADREDLRHFLGCLLEESRLGVVVQKLSALSLEGETYGEGNTESERVLQCNRTFNAANVGRQRDVVVGGLEERADPTELLDVVTAEGITNWF